MPTEGSGSVELTAAVQDYAKAIYELESRAGVASTNALAERLGVRPASVSGMLRKLDALGLVKHERYRGVRLTESGRKVALEVLRHHRLLELYLAESLGMGWDEVDAEADRLEHVISEEVEGAIAGGVADRGGGDAEPAGARAGAARNVHAGVGFRPCHASLSSRAGDRARGSVR